MTKQLDESAYKEVVENVVKRLVKEGFYDDKEEEEMDPFDEYEKGYPNCDFDVSDMTPERLASWCKNVGDFLYIINGLRGWRISVANTSSIVSEIVKDLHNCSGIKPTHDMDYLFYTRQREFVHDYVCVFKVIGVNCGDYYVVYQQPKSGASFDFDESHSSNVKV